MSPSAGDRDRLAADLAAEYELGDYWVSKTRLADAAYRGRDPMDDWRGLADRLIALGWMRRPFGYWSAEGDLYPEMMDHLRDVLPEAWAQGKQIVVADGVTLRFHELPPTLDEERLARALADRRTWTCPEDCGDSQWGYCAHEIALLAKAYREDTDAHD